MKFLQLLGLGVAAASIAATPSLANGTQLAASTPTSAASTQTKRTTVRVATIFPAAGELSLNKVAARTGPDPRAPVIKVFHQFRTDYRLQVVLAASVRLGTDGRPWYRVSVPMRPNGTMGWIPAASVSLAPTPNKIVISRSARTIDVYQHGHHALHAIVAVGAPGMETPVGHYYVTARFVPEDSFLGVFAVETSAYSKLSEWPGGGVVGLHGTSLPQLLGQAVSHGCVRVSNQTAEALKRLAPLGTPIWITA
jgi:lipoprotein-anchoring transpeptidase ErfK/SrfK